MEKMIGNTAVQERKADEGNINVCVFTQAERECVCERAHSARSTLCIPPINQKGS